MQRKVHPARQTNPVASEIEEDEVEGETPADHLAIQIGSNDVPSVPSTSSVRVQNDDSNGEEFNAVCHRAVIATLEAVAIRSYENGTPECRLREEFMQLPVVRRHQEMMITVTEAIPGLPRGVLAILPSLLASLGPRYDALVHRLDNSGHRILRFLAFVMRLGKIYSRSLLWLIPGANAVLGDRNGGMWGTVLFDTLAFIWSYLGRGRSNRAAGAGDDHGVHQV